MTSSDFSLEKELAQSKINSFSKYYINKGQPNEQYIFIHLFNHNN